MRAGKFYFAYSVFWDSFGWSLEFTTRPCLMPMFRRRIHLSPLKYVVLRENSRPSLPQTSYGVKIIPFLGQNTHITMGWYHWLLLVALFRVQTSFEQVLWPTVNPPITFSCRNKVTCASYLCVKKGQKGGILYDTQIKNALEMYS